ncbi:acetyl-CoA synthetase-like protein [Dacryopinax primogenitus]|uniref:Acetyl-CoA synthetase-like protein n=1 Tax=Dacryopinax primogenitus (strain DJM 731) TaxID=1858805 RepID=M5FUY1_DACPD|nr:acetyl-CoA synthetase-like protein [Dacryopinax primogenitus]EJU00064.1 acetyl-CoA synthetase-like protein [Dacryopinax primogenitus]
MTGTIIKPVDSTTNAGYVPTENIFAYLFQDQQVWRRFPAQDDKVVFHEPLTSQDLLYGRVRDDSLRFAHSLSKLVVNVPPKDDFGVPGAIVGPVVMIHLPNCCAFPVIFLGGVAANCTMNLVSPALGPNELVHVMELVHPDVVFTQPGELGEETLEKAFNLLPESRTKPKVFTVDVLQYPTDSSLPPSSVSDWLSLLGMSSFQVAPMDADEHANRVACIMWSSGTTGKSKGVMHSHRSLTAVTVLWEKYGSWVGIDSIWIALPPFYHIMGLTTVMLQGLRFGTKMVIMRKFDLEAYLRLIVEHHVTYLCVVPPLALALTKTPFLDEPWCDLSSVRSIGCGAAALGEDVIRELRRKTGAAVYMGYGLTETGPCTNFPESSWNAIEQYPGYSGQIFPEVQVQIQDEAGRPLPPGQAGEILLRSNLQMLGYVRNPKANAETFTNDGFVRTGDIGILDDERFIKIIDRIKDVIKYNGFQVSPVELDAVIGALPSVLDVGTTSIYSEQQASELPIAYVVPRSAELLAAVKRDKKNHPGLRAFAEEIYSTVESRCAYYKWLRGGIVLCDSVTKSPTGKIMRRQLKDITGIYIPFKSTGDLKAKL